MTAIGPRHRWKSIRLRRRYDYGKRAEVKQRIIKCRVCGEATTVLADTRDWKDTYNERPAPMPLCFMVHQEGGVQPEHLKYRVGLCGYAYHWRQPRRAPEGVIRTASEMKEEGYQVNCPDCLAHLAKQSETPAT